jgi:Ca-activated chloride channel family protein
LPFAAALLILSQGLTATPGWAATEGNRNVVFILDASGSMGAKIAGRIKMDVAKEVLSDLIGDLPGGVDVGLVAYGHRHKADCNDVETLAPLGPLDREALVQEILSLNQKGMTPITASVRKVAESLRGRPEGTTIVLVSGGEETCGGDPCALVKQLKASGLHFVMHVIGLGVTGRGTEQLACIAQAGGGSYLAARDAEEFASAARRALEETEQTVGALSLKAMRNGQPVDAWYEVRPAGAPSGTGPLAANPIGDKGETLKLVSGTYDIKIRDTQDVGNPVVSFSGVKVGVGKTVARVADFSGGSLKVQAQRNGSPVAAWFDVFPATASGQAQDEAVASSPIGEDGETVKLSPGVYDLQIKDMEDPGNPAQSFSGIRIGPGTVVEKVADFSGGTLKMNAWRNGSPIGAWFSVFRSGHSRDDDEDPLASNPLGEGGDSVQLTPGVYDLDITDPEDLGHPVAHFSAIKIQPGATVEKRAKFSGGTLRLKATMGGQPVAAWYVIYRGTAATSSD